MAKFADLLPGLVGGLSSSLEEQLKAKREQRSKLEQILAMAQAEALAKRQYPTAEEAAKQQALNAIQQMIPIPRPEGGFNRAELRAGAPQAIEQNVARNRLAALQEAGLLPRAQKSLEDIFNEAQARSQGTTSGRPIRLRAGQQDTALGYQQTLSQLGKLQQLLSDNPDIKTGLTPVGSQRWEFVRGSSLGNLLRQNKSPVNSEFFTTYNRLQDSYRRFVTGAQAGFPELAKFLPTALPSPAIDRPEQFQRNMLAFQSELQESVARMKNVLESEGLTPEQIDKVFSSLQKEGSGTGATTGNRIGRFSVEVE